MHEEESNEESYLVSFLRSEIENFVRDSDTPLRRIRERVRELNDDSNDCTDADHEIDTIFRSMRNLSRISKTFGTY